MLFRTLLGCFAMLLSISLPAGALRAADNPATALAKPTMIEIAMRSVVTVSFGGEEDTPDGSGFVAHTSGYIVTNTHVVPRKRGDTVRVGFVDGKSYVGKVVGRDPRTDIAVIKIAADRPLVPLQLAETSRPGLGTKVYALGSPMGKRFSVTAGIVSGYDRAYDASWPVDFLQHDAALNPGNSGGPLIDELGRVLGVNTATPPETLFDMGIALAVPSELVARIVPELVASGTVSRGALGVKVSSADAAMAAALGAPDTKGLLIDEVLPGSAADKAGLRTGDIVLQLDGRRLLLARDLSLALLDSRPGETRKLEIVRDGKRMAMAIELGRDDPDAGERGHAGSLSLDAMQRDDQPPAFGLTLEQRDGKIVVAAVEDQSVAQLYGLYEGDIVLAVNGIPAKGIGSLLARVEAMEGNVVVLRFAREGMGVFHVALPLTAEAAAARRPGEQKRFPQGPL